MSTYPFIPDSWVPAPLLAARHPTAAQAQAQQDYGMYVWSDPTPGRVKQIHLGHDPKYVFTPHKTGGGIIQERFTKVVIGRVHKASVLGRIGTVLTAIGTVLAGGYAFGHMSATLLRAAGLRGVGAIVGQSAVSGLKAGGLFLASVLGPAVPGYFISQKSWLLGVIYGWAGAVGYNASHLQAAMDLVARPETVIGHPWDTDPMGLGQYDIIGITPQRDPYGYNARLRRLREISAAARKARSEAAKKFPSVLRAVTDAFLGPL